MVNWTKAAVVFAAAAMADAPQGEYKDRGLDQEKERRRFKRAFAPGCQSDTSLNMARRAASLALGAHVWSCPDRSR